MVFRFKLDPEVCPPEHANEICLKSLQLADNYAKHLDVHRFMSDNKNMQKAERQG